MPKVLILRLSSMGDVIQTLSAVPALKKAFPDGAEVHFLTKRAFAPVAQKLRQVDKTIILPEGLGPLDLLKFFYKVLRSGEYTHVYDAHNNLRSQLFGLAHIATLLIPPRRWGQVRWARRSKERLKRFLLFKLRLNLFPEPYWARQSFLRPLAPWGVSLEYPGPLILRPQGPPAPQRFPVLGDEPFIALAPSAAWPLKIWPESHFHSLITMMPGQRFVILGGPQDEFCAHFQEDFPDRVLNLAGQLKFEDSLAVLQRAQALVSGDTGLLHWADSLEIPTVALVGPTAFGRPWAPSTQVLERELPCRPCTKDGRGRCSQSTYKRCMVDIAPLDASLKLREMIKGHRLEAP